MNLSIADHSQGGCGAGHQIQATKANSAEAVLEARSQAQVSTIKAAQVTVMRKLEKAANSNRKEKCRRDKRRQDFQNKTETLKQTDDHNFITFILSCSQLCSLCYFALS